MGLFQDLMTHKLCQNAKFEKGGTNIQVSILHVLLNILSIYPLLISRCIKSSHVILCFKENKMHWPVRTLG